jgi:hypothetical protein
VADPDEVLISPGAPRPQASKHLKMVPLNGQSENTYDDGKDLAPPANRGAPPPMGGPMGPAQMGPPPMMGIQGPVAGGAGAAMGPMGPMGAGPGMPHPAYGPMDQDPRATSQRVWIVIVSFVMLVCVSILGSAALLMVAFVSMNVPEPEPELPLGKQVARTAPPSRLMDTGSEVAKERAQMKSEPSPRPRRPTRPRPSSGTSKAPAAPRPAPAAAAAAEPEPVGGPGTVTVKLGSGVHATRFEVNCGGGAFRERASIAGGAGGSGTMQNVPASDCYLTLVGAGTKKRFKFSGSKNFTCSGVGSDLMCR